MKSRLGSLAAIHLAVLLFGVAGLFGKLLSLSSTFIVFGRTIFASLALLLVLALVKTDIRIKSGKDALGLVLMGVVLAIHWVTFFYAIQISTVAIGLLTFSSFPIFVTLLEPVFFKEKIKAFDIYISLAVFAGLVLVVPEFNIANNLTRGVIWGTLSGFTFAFLSVLNKKFVTHYPALTITLYQDLIASLVLFPFVGSAFFILQPIEYGYLLFLGVVCTALAHTLFIQGMVTIKAQLASVIACLEPVYGIILAVIFLREIPTPQELFGGSIIIGAIIIATRKK